MSVDEQAALTEAEVCQLREAHYNAELIHVRQVHEDLRILRVRPDTEIGSFEPGQYTVLGLGYWEPRYKHLPDDPHDPQELRKLCRRAYSISCPLADSEGRLWPASACDFLEFYITLIRRAPEHAPALTPRLFALEVGARLFVGPKVTGRYTLRGVRPDDHCLFVATGTGEAPHNAMIAHLLSRGHRGRIVAVTCVRQRRDLGYLSAHRAVERQFPQYRYVTLTTREPENLNPAHPRFVGKRYLQDYFVSGDFEREQDLPLDPLRLHAFLCGNPAMIGAPTRAPDGSWRLPEELGMVEVLQRRGFTIDTPGQPGNIHFEKYW